MKPKNLTKLLAIAALMALALCPVLAAAEPARPYWWDRLDTLAQRDGYALIRPLELKKLYDQAESMVVVDARTVHEFKAGHLPGARNVEFHMGHASRLDAAKEKQLRDALGTDKKRRVVVYDRGLQCVRSQMAAQWAVSLGYENVWMLPEGWMGWASLTQQGSSMKAKPLPASGGAFPKLRLTILDGQQDRSYLGLAPGTEIFELGALKAQYILIELYNELCFACCQSVPELNRLLDLIKKEPSLASRLKMIGIGVGNLKRDVHRFRHENNIGFPLFSDQSRALHKSLGEPALPVIYLVRLVQPSPRIVCVEQGPFTSAQELLKRVKNFIRAAPKLAPASTTSD